MGQEMMNEALKQILWSASKGVIQSLAQKLTANVVSSVVNYSKKRDETGTRQPDRVPVTCIGGYYKDMVGYIYFHNSFNQWFMLTSYGQWTLGTPASQFFLVAYLYQDSTGYYYMQTAQGWWFLHPQKGWITV